MVIMKPEKSACCPLSEEKLTFHNLLLNYQSISGRAPAIQSYRTAGIRNPAYFIAGENLLSLSFSVFLPVYLNTHEEF